MEEIKICRDCGSIIEGAAYELPNGEYICEDCYESDYFFCEECEQIHHVDNAIEAYKGISRARWARPVKITICTDCAYGNYYRCSCCGEWFSDELAEDAHGDYVCDTCIDDNYHTCNGCGELFTYDEGQYDDYDDWYCDNCYEDIRSSRKIKDYGYKPEAVFKTVHDVFFGNYNGTELTFGAELEIDDGDNAEDVAEAILECSDDVYCKHDGSLGNEGVEIVSHPCTLEYHMTKLGWDKITTTAKDYNFSSHDAGTCGLHIHVGKRQLHGVDDQNTTIAKIIIAMNKHWDEFVKFSRRTSNQLGHWAELPKIDIGREDAIEEALKTEHRGRYQAINLTNWATIEFRLYRGTLNMQTLMASFQLTSNICKYCMAKTLDEVLDGDFEDIVHFEEFEELNAYVKERGIVSEHKEVIRTKLPEPRFNWGTYEVKNENVGGVNGWIFRGRLGDIFEVVYSKLYNVMHYNIKFKSGADDWDYMVTEDELAMAIGA